MIDIKELKIGGYVKLMEEYTQLGDNMYPNNIYPNMKAFLGKVVQIKKLDDTFFTQAEGWAWKFDMIEKIITEEENPEYFL